MAHRQNHMVQKGIITFKVITVGIVIFFGLISCNQNSAKQTGKKADSVLLADKEVFTLYKKVDTIVYVVKALKTGKESVDLHLYEVNISIGEHAKQRFVSVDHLAQKNVNSIKSKLQGDYTWIPLQGDKILFVQIQPTDGKNEVQLLDKRQEIEGIIGNALADKKLGEWIAGDLGPGGGNMLYSVKDIDRSLEVILNVLQKNGLEKSILIGRRVVIDKDDWFYEVIYPIRYSGDFNTM